MLLGNANNNNKGLILPYYYKTRKRSGTYELRENVQIVGLEYYKQIDPGNHGRSIVLA